MLILALDTATAQVGAAVSDGREVLGTAHAHGPTRHGELLAPLVAEALRLAHVTPADLTDIGVGTGPGPFTGLRVGLVFAAVMGSARGIPVRGVCTLDVIAAEIAARPGAPAQFAVATDARRREVYWARYSASQRVAGPEVSLPAVLAQERSQRVPVFGAGAVLYPTLADPAFPPAEWPQAPNMGVLGALVGAQIQAGEPVSAPQPLYLRRPDAQANITRKPVLPAPGEHVR